MQKFKNRYRIPSARLATWNYGWPGSYFITICTKNREHFFGEIRHGEMYLNETGLIADQCWAALPEHFKKITLGEFVIMPNHTHGIITIEPDVDVVDGGAVDVGVVDGGAVNDVETGHALSLRQNRFRNPGKNTISTMVGSFKSAVTRLSRSINPEFGWQTRFHDHIIRNHMEYGRFAGYILNNPANWKEDRFHKKQP